MSHLGKELQKARPRLKVVSPLSHWVVLIMALFNIVLGISFLFAIDQNRLTASLIIVNDVFTFWFWGWVFIGIGLLKLYALVMNNWNLARRSLLVGVSVKAAWMVALTIRSFVSPGTIFVNVMWITIALLQMGTYIWFMPPDTNLLKTPEEIKDA